MSAAACAAEVLRSPMGFELLAYLMRKRWPGRSQAAEHRLLLASVDRAPEDLLAPRGAVDLALAVGAVGRAGAHGMVLGSAARADAVTLMRTNGDLSNVRADLRQRKAAGVDF